MHIWKLVSVNPGKLTNNFYLSLKFGSCYGKSWFILMVVYELSQLARYKYNYYLHIWMDITNLVPSHGVAVVNSGFSNCPF